MGRGLSLLFAMAVARQSAAQPVTNGTLDTADPAVVAIVDDTDQVGCTATVIAPHVAITAAHCVGTRDPRKLRVFFGNVVADGGTFIDVSGARLHPEYDPETLLHDIAMLALREPSPVPVVALDPRTLDASVVGDRFRVVGFGTTAGGAGDSGTKREGIARVSDLQPFELLARPDPAQPCRGDSGGPALFGDVVTAVVSRGDNDCVDHAIYARVDVARAPLIDPYLADTAAGTAHTGDACLYEGHCAEGPCLQTRDDPELFFCSQTCAGDDDCPAAMDCSDGSCRYPEPSPGALGSPCDAASACTSERCERGVCTISCLGMAEVCPADFECVATGSLAYFCFAEEPGCTDCSTGTGAPVWLVLIVLVRARRTGRSSSPRGSRAGRSRRAP